MVTVADVRERLPLAEMNDAEIASPLARATRDFRDTLFEEDTNNYDRIEAVSCLCIYYIAPLLWTRIQNRANEFNETMQTFQDVEKFQDFWKTRAESVPYIIDADDTPESSKMGSFGFGAY